MSFPRSSSLLASALTVFLALTPFSQVAGHPAPRDATVRTIYQFPNHTALENVAIRPNGKIIATVISSPEIYQIDPFNLKDVSLVHHFPSALAALGISEIEPDVYAAILGNYSTATGSAPKGSFAIWKIDLRPFQTLDNGDVISPATVSKIASIPDAVLPNGLTLLAPGSPYILVADSGLGAVWRVDVNTGEYKSVLSDPLMLPSPDESLKIGINGIHTLGDTLYFTNTFLNGGFLVKVPIHLSGPGAGTAAGNYNVYSKNGVGDDFALDSKGNAYVAQNLKNGIQLVTPDGKFSLIAGNENSTELAGDAAVQFGRTARDSHVLYAVTSGGNGITLPGLPEGGKIVAVDLSKL